MTMEGIVRPFQSPNSINDNKSITILPKVAKTTGVLEWGSPGAPPAVQGLNFNVKKNDKDYKEKSRTTTDVRIENPDDSNQFIMEQRINTIKFDVKDALPLTGGNSSGSAAGSLQQTSYKSSDENQARLAAYGALIAQGMSPESASSAVYGNTSNVGQIPKEQGPDSANYTLDQPQQ